MAESSGIIFCFCGPSAAGKSTLCERLITGDSSLLLSVSTTTRKQRGDEVEGENYFFVSPEEFRSRVDQGFFIEHAEYNGNLYGTEKRNIELAASQGKDLLLDIEVQGVEQLKKLYPERVVTVFVFPPSISVLEARLRARGTETEEKIEGRMKTAREELKVLTSPGFSDYLLTNDNLDECVKGAAAIVATERRRFSRLGGEIVQGLFG